MKSTNNFLLLLLVMASLLFAGCGSTSEDVVLDNQIEIESDSSSIQDIEEETIEESVENDLVSDDDDIEIGELI